MAFEPRQLLVFMTIMAGAVAGLALAASIWIAIRVADEAHENTQDVARNSVFIGTLACAEVEDELSATSTFPNIEIVTREWVACKALDPQEAERLVPLIQKATERRLED